MRFLEVIFICFSCSLLASEHAIMLRGVHSKDSQTKVVAYLDLINKTLRNFGYASQKCLGECNSTKSNSVDYKLRADTIIYINEWLRVPGSCNIRQNRKYKESRKACYARARRNFKRSIPYIERAAKEFDMNASHLACLLLQESQFLETAKSGTGPLGLAQMGTDTLRTEKLVFKSSLPKSCNNILNKDCAKVRRSQRTRCRNDLSFCKTRKYNYDKRKIIEDSWKNYARFVNKKQGRSVLSVSKYCAKDCRKNMYWSIGAAARYVTEIRKKDAGAVMKKAPNDKENFLMACSLYNAGPGFTREFLHPIKSFTPGWERNIPKVLRKKRGKWIDVAREPRKYVKRIRRCIDYRIGDAINKQ